MVSNYFQDCKYLVNKLQPYVYLISEDALKDIKIDNGDAYISSISETPTRLDVYNITLTEGDELDERFKFTHTLTFSVNGYANKDDFDGKYYVILKDDDGTYWLINPLFPCKITYTYTLAYEENHTDFNIGTVSNHPVLRLLGMTDSQPYECKKYFISGIDALWLNEKRYTAHDGNAVKYTNGGFKAIEYNKKSAVFTEEFDGTKVSHSVNFNVLFSVYKSSWHYNLLEFKDNIYAAVIKTTDGKYALCGFGYGLQPSFTVNANDSETINYVEIKLQDAHDVGDTIYFYDEIIYEYLSGKTWEYTSEYNGYECVGAGTAVYLLKKEVDALENETGRFMVREGHRSEFPELDLVEEEFDDDVEFENMDCGSQDCTIQTGLPSTINFNSVGCKQYYLKADSDWTITSSSSSISVSPSSGDAETPYTISVCNNIAPSSSAVTSNLTLSYCNTTSIINVIVSEDEDACLPQGATYNISANEQTLTIPTKCCVTSVKDSLNIGLNITVYESYISVIVPENNTGVNRTITLLVVYCDGTSGNITINQSNVFERWVDDSTLCVGYSEYKRQYKYTGTTSSSMTARTDEYRDVLIRTDSPNCGYIEPIYKWENSGTTCVGYDKWQEGIKQVSYDNGESWENVIPEEYSAVTLIEVYSEDCGVEYRWYNLDPSTDYYCSGTTKYYKQQKQYSVDSGSTWVNVNPAEYKMGTSAQGQSTDCGYIPPTPQYRTTSGTPYCVGYDKYVEVYSQVSYDGGVTWITTATTPTLVEAQSTDCGYVPPTPQYRWVRTGYEMCILTPASGNYLTFVATESGTFKFNGNSINYSLDNGATWTELASNTNSPTVSAGSKIMWKATLTPQAYDGIGIFGSSGNFTVEGNIMSLLYGDNFVGQTNLTGKNYAFYSLFENCKKLTSAENLVLPATTLANACYIYMFYGCSSLTTAPELPATTLANQCYQGLFNGCTNLNSITCLATYISASNCTTNWVSGVASEGTFVKASSMSSWISGDNGIPSGWTVQNA